MSDQVAWSQTDQVLKPGEREGVAVQEVASVAMIRRRAGT